MTTKWFNWMLVINILFSPDVFFLACSTFACVDYFLTEMHWWVQTTRNIQQIVLRHLVCLNNLTVWLWSCAMPSDVFFAEWFLFFFLLSELMHSLFSVRLIFAAAHLHSVAGVMQRRRRVIQMQENWAVSPWEDGIVWLRIMFSSIMQLVCWRSQPTINPNSVH